MTYTEAQETLGKRDRKKLENNTCLERTHDGIVIRLHNTAIIAYHPNGRVILNSGGWRTLTTKDRLNKYLPSQWGISQENGIWYIVMTDGGKWHREGVFADGATLHPDGTWTGIERHENATKAKLALRRKVAKYAKEFVAAFLEGKVEAPSSGDCWYCVMTVSGTHPTDAGKTLGEAFKDKDHILSHIEERYFVPSLLQRALDTFDTAPVCQWAMVEQWSNGEDKEKCAGWGERVKDRLTRAVRRYCLRQLEEVA